MIGTRAGLSDFHAGDRVEYIMAKCPSVGRHETWYMPATVEKVTNKVLVIRVDRWPARTRNTIPSMVRHLSEPIR